MAPHFKKVHRRHYILIFFGVKTKPSENDASFKLTLLDPLSKLIHHLVALKPEFEPIRGLSRSIWNMKLKFFPRSMKKLQKLRFEHFFVSVVRESVLVWAVYLSNSFL